ncbi:MAG: hypothetical protein SCARUB_03341 [Candidatus Scalindua rubra]|uniref:Uncharacterized protein n=1 Tax=Candidatus Scalindua rubra TaxID=1872076 RepID=A0A1E3X7B0_9BACT|nr:MAG: hypothetical protein SCARUB_03341 [Candidatus Scalindua rubra]
MFGSPKDLEGQCNAHCYIADNHATIRCQLAPNHKGRHREVSRGGEINNRMGRG